MAPSSVKESAYGVHQVRCFPYLKNEAEPAHETSCFNENLTVGRVQNYKILCESSKLVYKLVYFLHLTFEVQW
jgi:hypothetical protein